MGAQASDAASERRRGTPLLVEMLSPEVASLLQRGHLDVLLPLGALEQHGPHLPLGTDAFIADALAREVARRAGDMVVAPCLPVGCSDHHLSFAGTASISVEAAAAYLRSVAVSLLRHGFRCAYMFSAHAGNIPALRAALASFDAADRKRVAIFVDWPAQRDAMHDWARRELGLGPDEVGSHAGHFETSIMLHLAPELVDMQAAPRGFIGSAQDATTTMAEKGIAAVSRAGVVGDARGATPEAGGGYFEILAASITSFVSERRAAGAPR
jgi:creatinine amidohydrolase